MKRIATLVLAALMLTPASARTMPTLSEVSPRIQSIYWTDGATFVLTALPDTALTVMLEPGEQIQRATLSGNRSWDVAVSAEADTFQVTPVFGAAPAELLVETDRRQYQFALETGRGLMAAYLVRFEFADVVPTAASEFEEEADNTLDNLAWSYRLRGDREVRPLSVRDNGQKTVIEYAPGQPLPAVFAIGATGDEEVVDGYMRGDTFVIDRVHPELVFRIDKEKATARRNSMRDGER